MQNVITENNELSAACVRDTDSATSFSTEIDSGVSELRWVDVEVTCDVCSVVHLSHAESRWNVAGEKVAAVDGVVSAIGDAPSGRHTQTVVPLYK